MFVVYRTNDAWYLHRGRDVWRGNMEWKIIDWKYLWILALLLSLSYVMLRQIYEVHFPMNDRKYTVRVNTFRRNDLLEKFLEHYTTCNDIADIQVVWSDQKYQVPQYLQEKYSSSIVLFEIHSTDKLSNRFNPLTTPTTEGILSIDDDLLIPCVELTTAHQIWLSNKRALVGFSPRMTAHDPNSDHDRYLRWQHTWWNGIYSIILTKACFLHRKYLDDYFKILSPKLIEEMDKNRNCEDIAMAYVVAKQSKAPPVWVKGLVYEEADSGISAGQSHFIDRSICLSQLQEYDTSSTSSVWVTAYQKALLFSSWSDFLPIYQGRRMEYRRL